MAKKKKDDASILTQLSELDILNSNLPFIKSGINILDAYIAGEKSLSAENIGFPTGKIIGISGNTGVGKSTMLLNVCRRYCEQGLKILYIDVEGGLNVKSLMAYGILDYAAYDSEIETTTDLKQIKIMKEKCLQQFLNGEKQFYSISPRTYNQTMKAIRNIFAENKKGEIKFLVIDSIKDIIASRIFNNDDELEDQQMMIDAKSMEYFLIKLKNFMTFQTCVCVILNQLRTKFRGQFAVLDEAGGQAWLHRTDIRLFMKEKEKIFQKVRNNLGEIVDKKIGNWVEIEVRKGRFGNPFTKLLLPLIFGKGISLVYLYARKLETIGKVKKSGSWYVFSMPEIGVEEKYQGAGKTYKIIKQHFSKVEKYIVENDLLIVEALEEEIEENEE